MIQGLEHLSHSEQLEKLDLCSLEEEEEARLGEVLQHLKLTK